MKNYFLILNIFNYFFKSLKKSVIFFFSRSIWRKVPNNWSRLVEPKHPWSRHVQTFRLIRPWTMSMWWWSAKGVGPATATPKPVATAGKSEKGGKAANLMKNQTNRKIQFITVLFSHQKSPKNTNSVHPVPVTF